MIVKDEEQFLADALRSVAGVVDEICIVDTGSTDGTREIARAHGARLIDLAWNDDFAQARNAALALATRRWIIVLDADERLAAGSRAAVAAFRRAPSDGRGRWIACRNLTDKGAGAMSNLLVRIFPNDPRIQYRNPIHEFVALDGSEAGLPSDRTSVEIVHHGYLQAVVAQRNKGERNLRLSRRAAERDPSDPFHQYNLGMASLLAADRPAAIAALERMRRLTRSAPRGYRVHALVALADLYVDALGDTQTALARIEECLACVPNYSNAHYAHGRILARCGRWFEAREAFGRAIAAGVHDGEQFVVDDEIAIWKAHAEIGATLMHESRFAEALAWFELAARARPAAQALLVNRAKCCEALGDLSRAGQLYDAALRGHADAATATQWINFLFRRGRDGEALAAIDTTLDLFDDDERTLLLGSAAAAHLRAGSVDAAAAVIERALAADGADVAATLTALAGHFGQPQFADLIHAAVISRAPSGAVAYIPCA